MSTAKWKWKADGVSIDNTDHRVLPGRDPDDLSGVARETAVAAEVLAALAEAHDAYRGGRADYRGASEQLYHLFLESGKTDNAARRMLRTVSEFFGPPLPVDGVTDADLVPVLRATSVLLVRAATAAEPPVSPAAPETPAS